MPKIQCPHDGVELETVPDKRTPQGLLRCPKCHCIFRVVLAVYDADCAQFKGIPKKKKESGAMLTTPFFPLSDPKETAESKKTEETKKPDFVIEFPSPMVGVDETSDAIPKRKRGRPKGSKNKPKEKKDDFPDFTIL